MKSIPEGVKNIVEHDSFLHFGLANAVLNLSKTARFIQPLIQTRTKKDVSVSAITMALSRLRLSKRKTNVQMKSVKLSGMSVNKNLIEMTYEKTAHATQTIWRVEKYLRGKGAYLVATIGTNEITMLCDAAFSAVIAKAFGFKPKIQIPNLVSITVQFDEHYASQVGMIYTLIQQLSFQNINVVEFSSTYTEFVFYFDKKDLKLAFDTLYDQFM